MHRAEAEGNANETGVTRARASLPGLQIDIVHERAATDDAERISIDIKAMPSFEAVARAFEAASPLALWGQGAHVAWASWLRMTSALMLPWALAHLPPQSISDAASEDRRSSE